MSSRLKYLLIASVLLNFLLLGIGIGTISSDFISKPPHRMPPKPENAYVFEQMETRNQDQKLELEKQIHETRSHIHQLLRQDSLDAEVFQQAVEDLKAVYDQRLQLQSTDLFELTRELPQNQRERLIEALEHQPHNQANRPRPLDHRNNQGMPPPPR